MDDAAEALDQHAASPSFRALHAATRCLCCPPSLYSLLLKMHEAQLLERDERGRLPLAVACLDPLSNRSIGAITKVQLLLAECRCAASARDRDGRPPVLLSLANGLAWEEGVENLIRRSPRSLLRRDPVTLLPAFLLAATGAETRAARFEAVSAGRVATGSGSSSAPPLREGTARPSAAVGPATEDTASLSTIYSLLRSDPAQLENNTKKQQQQQQQRRSS